MRWSQAFSPRSLYGGSALRWPNKWSALFQAGENHGIVGLTLRTPDDTRTEWERS